MWRLEAPSCSHAQTSGSDLQQILPEREFNCLSLAAALDLYERL